MKISLKEALERVIEELGGGYCAIQVEIKKHSQDKNSRIIWQIYNDKKGWTQVWGTFEQALKDIKGEYQGKTEDVIVEEEV